ncbi:hypothetical protein RSOLAG22IIIB_02802 [Rhizoctonia solani]|uniref:Uncharacterized protein n=1 Tax=Rhizoctonia solani TaxID=456999 RepID=A0A0K6GII4_9AGAM|nr:hypothetical protein RSOLAG22IIIB_02802 [Rhizoctonia solani]
MSANVTQNLGGFRAPESAPPADASLNSLQSNNPYRQPSPAPEPFDEPYPSYAPPSYDQVTSTAPSPIPSPLTDSKRERESRDITYENQYSAGPSTSLAPPQAVQRDQPMTPASGSTDLLDQAMSKINPRDPLDPIPICFSRVIPAPSPEITYQTLPQPLVIHARPGKTALDDAFVTTGTPALHKHDIWAEDWVRLLEDIHIVARLTTGQKITASILPITMHVGFAGHFISRAIKQGMKNKKVGGVTQLLQIWNERFFKPRRLEIILCRGDYRVPIGSNDQVRLPAPDCPHAHSRSMSHSSSSSSSSDSEHESMGRGSGRGHMVRGRGAGRREYRQARREERRERREERRERRDERREQRAYRREEKRSKEPYRLVVVSI